VVAEQPAATSASAGAASAAIERSLMRVLSEKS
jgi:hypothetical protein